VFLTDFSERPLIFFNTSKEQARETTERNIATRETTEKDSEKQYQVKEAKVCRRALNPVRARAFDPA
jgi:hypothetical protein